MHADEQAIREVVATWIQASRAGDTDRVLGLMADDVVFLGPGRPPMRGKAAFAAAAAAQATPQPFKLEGVSEIEEIRVFGEWAYLWTKLSVIVVPTEGTAAVKRRGPTLSILKKQDGKWAFFRDATRPAVVSD